MRPKRGNKYIVRFELKKILFSRAKKTRADGVFQHSRRGYSVHFPYRSFFLTQPVSISSRKTVAMTVSRMMPTRDQRQA